MAYLTKGGTLRKGTIALLAGAFVVLLLIAGCGGGDSGSGNGGDNAGAAGTDRPSAVSEDRSSDAEDGGSGGTGGPVEGKPISKAAYLKLANDICHTAFKNIAFRALPILQKAGKKSERAREAAEVELLPTVLIPGLKEEVEELRALGAPEGDEKQVEAIVKAIEDVIEKGETDPEAFQRTNPYFEAATMAAKYGLKTCPYS